MSDTSDHRRLKNLLFEQVARVTKAVSSPKRLELLELLAQAPKTVEQLAQESESSTALTSAHLKALRAANLVQHEVQGKYRLYRVDNALVTQLWTCLHRLAQSQLPELQHALSAQASAPRVHTLPESWEALFAAVQDGQVLLLDTRPTLEFQADHLPGALSLPLTELAGRLDELPRDRLIITYCRGPFCLYARDATLMLRARGFMAEQWQDGVAEWRKDGAAG